MTVQTCFGRYRFLCLPFGANVSSEIILKHLQGVLGDLQGIIVIADDIVIHGRDQAEHDANLAKFLQRCDSIGIRLNSSK